MSTFDDFLPLLAFALTAACGGVLLAWMPPGAPGGRRPRDWVVLTAASALLGGSASVWIVRLSVPAWITFPIFAVLLVLRLALRPLPLAPRHEPPLRRESTSARCLLLLAWLAAIASLFGSAIFAAATPRRGAWLFGMSALAVLVLVDWALDVARCRALVRAAAISAFGAVVACGTSSFENLALAAALFFTAGAACTISWYRRGDRRALTLAAVYFAVTVTLVREGWLLAAAGMITIVIGTPRPSRLIASATCGVAAVLFGVPTLLAPVPHSESAGTGFSSKMYFIIGFLFSAVLVARWFDLRRMRMPAWNPSGAAVGHERAMLLRTLLFALIFAWLSRAMRLQVPADFALLPALFVLVLVFGSSLERLLQRA